MYADNDTIVSTVNGQVLKIDSINCDIRGFKLVDAWPGAI
jgi:hypothetical protein